MLRQEVRRFGSTGTLLNMVDLSKDDPTLPTCRAASTRSILLRGLLVGLAVAPIHARSVAGQPITLPPIVPDVSAARVVRLADQSAAVLWTGSDHVTWAQRVDLWGALIDQVTPVGQLTSGHERLSGAPLAVPFSDGDLATVGLLRDGRITYARGSRVFARRVAPRVIVAASPPNVAGLAIAATADGFSVLVLRSANTATLEGAMNVALHSFDSRGDENHAPLYWTSANGFAPRMVVCGGTRHLAWRTAKGVVLSRVDPAAHRSRETLVAGGRGTPAAFGPMVCVADEARVLTSWLRGSSASGVASEVAVAGLTRKEPEQAGWKIVKLPGQPQSTLVGDRTLAAYANDSKLQLVVQGKVTTNFVTLDLATLRVTSNPLPFDPGSCLPSPDGTRAVCGNAQREASKSECRNTYSKLTISFLPARPMPGSDRVGSDAFWKSGQIVNVDALSRTELSAKAERLACGCPEWSSLRNALQHWCRDSTGATAREPYCAVDQPSSLLYQAVHCTDQPLTCGAPPRGDEPSVSRAEFNAGRVEFGYAKCSVWFARKASAWSVDDFECTGED